jgi:hypothetical protein
MKEFNVINYDINRKEFISYNIIPYLVSCYDDTKDKPITFDDFKEFVKKESMYQWWSRCEYEIVLSPWPYITSPSERYDKKGENDVEAWKEHWNKHLKECQKIDVHYQVMMNLDIITALVIDSVING